MPTESLYGLGSTSLLLNCMLHCTIEYTLPHRLLQPPATNFDFYSLTHSEHYVNCTLCADVLITSEVQDVGGSLPDTR